MSQCFLLKNIEASFMIKVYPRWFLPPHWWRHSEGPVARYLLLPIQGVLATCCFPFSLLGAALLLLSCLSSLTGLDLLGVHHVLSGFTAGPPGYRLLSTPAIASRLRSFFLSAPHAGIDLSTFRKQETLRSTNSPGDLVLSSGNIMWMHQS